MIHKSIIIQIFLLIFFAIPAESQKIIRDRESKFIVNIGDEFPRFEYVTSEGDTLNSDFLRGQTTLIQFAAAWCPFSRDQLKYIEKNIWKEHHNNTHFELICFCVDQESDIANFKEIVESDNLTFPISYDPEERIYRLFVTPQGSVTRSVIIDKQGRIAYLSDAFDKRNFRRTAKVVNKLLKENY